MDRAHIARGFRAILLTRVLRIAANGVLILALTRVFFTPGQYGLLFFTLSVFGVAVMFANLGFGKSAARYVSEYTEKDSSQIPHILRSGFAFNLASILLVGAVFAFGGRWLARALGEPSSGPLLTLGAAYVAFRSLQTFTTLTFQGFNRVTWSAAVNATASVGKLVFGVGLVALGFGTIGALGGYIASYAVAAAVGLYVLYTRFYVTYEGTPTPEPGLRRRLLEYSVPLTATRGANVLDKRVDTILVGVLLNPVAVGYYTLGKQVADFVMAPAASLGFTISPTYGQQKEAGHPDRAASVYETSFEYILLLYVPAATGIVLLAEPTIRHVFGTDYLGAIPVLQILSAFVVLQAIDKITNDGLDYLGRARVRAYTKAITAVANALLNLLLIPVLGVAGAAVATVVTFSAMVVVNVYIIHQELSLDLNRLLRSGLRIVAISAAMAVVVVFVLPYVTDLLTLIGVILLGVLVWATLSVLGGLFGVREIRTILS